MIVCMASRRSSSAEQQPGARTKRQRLGPALFPEPPVADHEAVTGVGLPRCFLPVLASSVRARGRPGPRMEGLDLGLEIQWRPVVACIDWPLSGLNEMPLGEPGCRRERD